MQELLNAQYRLRKIIGFLAISLPLIVFLVHKKVLASVSHYYYTSASVFFIGALFSFGLVLISYKGYALDKTKKEKMSDDLLTTLAGIFIIATAIIPTKCMDSGDVLLFCGDGYLLGHSDHIRGGLHLFSAGMFLAVMGWMCVYKFTLSPISTPNKKHFYRSCGYIVWVCIGVLVIIFSIEKILDIKINNKLNGYTFILESIAVGAFGTAWLIKGKIEENLNGFKSYFSKIRAEIKKDMTSYKLHFGNGTK